MNYNRTRGWLAERNKTTRLTSSRSSGGVIYPRIMVTPVEFNVVMRNGTRSRGGMHTRGNLVRGRNTRLRAYNWRRVWGIISQIAGAAVYEKCNDCCKKIPAVLWQPALRNSSSKFSGLGSEEKRLRVADRGVLKRNQLFEKCLRKNLPRLSTSLRLKRFFSLIRSYLIILLFGNISLSVALNFINCENTIRYIVK